MADALRLGLILSATDRMSRVIDSAVGKSSARLRQLGQVAKQFAVTGTIGAGFIGAGTAIAKVSLDAAGEVEKYKAVIKTMLGSTEAAEKRFKEMSDFASTTPFNLQGVVEMGNQLQAIGMYSKKSMTLVGDLAAASGKPLEQVMGALAKMKSGQKGIAIDMFRDLLISNEDWIKATGKGVTKNGEMLASTSELLAALPKIIETKKFSGMMANLNQTYQGQISNMEDATFRLKASFGQLILPIAKDVIPKISNLMGKFQAWTEKNPKLAKGLLYVVFALGALALVLAAVTAVQWAFNASVLANPYTWIVIAIIALIAAIAVLVVKWEEITKWWRESSVAMKLLLAPLMISLAPIIYLAFLIRKLIDNWKKFPEMLRNTIKWLKESDHWFAKIIRAAILPFIVYFKIIKGVIFGVIDGISALIRWFKTSDNWFATLVRGGLNGLVIGFTKFKNILVWVANALKSVWEWVKKIAGSAIMKVVNLFSSQTQKQLGVDINSGPESKSMAAVKTVTSSNTSTYAPSNLNKIGGNQLNYSPNITISGANTVSSKEEFKKTLNAHKNEIAKLMSEISANKQRIAFAQ